MPLAPTQPVGQQHSQAAASSDHTQDVEVKQEATDGADVEVKQEPEDAKYEIPTEKQDKRPDDDDDDTKFGRDY